MINYTAKYTKIDSGYMGQLIDWPEHYGHVPDLANFCLTAGFGKISMKIIFCHLD